MDGSGSVRQAAHALVKSVLSLVSSDVISPFFTILVAHLKCGLTHIKEKIQLDALKLLELYLQHCSDLLVHLAGHILPVLIGLLSKQGTVQSHSNGSLKKKKNLIRINNSVNYVNSIALVSNPNSNFASKCSRMNIFSLCFKLLDSLLIVDNPLQSFINCDFTLAIQDRERVFGCLESLVSVLLESWVECCPADVLSSKTPCTQSFSLMESIVNTLSVLVKVMMKVTESSEWPASTVARMCKISHDISIHIMCHFPFKMSTSSSHSDSIFVMNFMFCETALLLHKLLCTVGREEKDKLALTVLRYIGGLDLCDIGSITSSAQNLPLCSQVVVDVMPLVRDISHRGGVVSHELKTVFAFFREFYLACHPHSRSKPLLVRCLSGMFVRELAAHGIK